MTLLPFDVTVPSGAPRGRSVKFTPERMEQIKNLVERGKNRDEIAEIIGCTVGSLQVTCSKAGISLRRLREDTVPVRRIATPGDGHGRGVPPMPSRPQAAPVMSESQAKATLILRLEMTGRSREAQVLLPLDLIGDLAVMAEFRGIGLTELIAETLTELVRKMENDAPLTQG
jgi:hypothetical protein